MLREYGVTGRRPMGGRNYARHSVVEVDRSMIEQHRGIPGCGAMQKHHELSDGELTEMRSGGEKSGMELGSEMEKEKVALQWREQTGFVCCRCRRRSTSLLFRIVQTTPYTIGNLIPSHPGMNQIQPSTDMYLKERDSFSPLKGTHPSRSSHFLLRRESLDKYYKPTNEASVVQLVQH